MAALNSIDTIDEYTKKHRAQEEKRYRDAYPFHPDLVELFYAKWTQLEGFQQTRGWEKVREMLKERHDVNTAATARLETNLRAACSEMVSQIVMAYCIAVTVNDSNDIAAYRINVDNDPLFGKIMADKRLRIESTAANAETLLPGGPYDLWAKGEKARFVKDLVGTFAATARLPKMLNRTAILETLLQGCEAGDFVLRVTRGDKLIRTF